MSSDERIMKSTGSRRRTNRYQDVTKSQVPGKSSGQHRKRTTQTIGIQLAENNQSEKRIEQIS